MRVAIDNLLKEAVNRARLMFAGHVSSTSEVFSDHVTVTYKDRAGVALAHAVFTMADDEVSSFDYSVDTVGSECSNSGTGLVAWAKYLHANNWLASWVEI